jgi:predicted PurR-regulated permease PerM
VADAPERLGQLERTIQSTREGLEQRVGERAVRRVGLDADVLGRTLRSGRVASFVRSSLDSSLGVVSASGLTLLFFLFLLLQREGLRAKLEGLLESWSYDRERAGALLDDIAGNINRYLWLKTAISTVTGIVFGLVAWLSGLPYAVFWGFLGFALNYVPSIGPIIASIPPVILCFLEFESTLWAVGVAVAMVGVQFLSGNVVEPKLMGERLDLNIVTVLLCLFFWGLVWGPMGMLLAVPLTVAGQIALRQSSRTRYMGDLMAS